MCQVDCKPSLGFAMWLWLLFTVYSISVFLLYNIPVSSSGYLIFPVILILCISLTDWDKGLCSLHVGCSQAAWSSWLWHGVVIRPTAAENPLANSEALHSQAGRCHDIRGTRELWRARLHRGHWSAYFSQGCTGAGNAVQPQIDGPPCIKDLSTRDTAWGSKYLVSIQLQPPRRGQPLYKRQNK